MIDPTLALQDQIVVKLKEHAGLAAIVAGRVFDAVPAPVSRPYVSLGQPQILPDKATCVDGCRVSFPVNGWATGPKSVQIKQISAAILDALDEVDFDLQDHRVVVFEVDEVVYLDDPDEVKHVAITFTALTEPKET